MLFAPFQAPLPPQSPLHSVTTLKPLTRRLDARTHTIKHDQQAPTEGKRKRFSTLNPHIFTTPHILPSYHLCWPWTWVTWGSKRSKHGSPLREKHFWYLLSVHTGHTVCHRAQRPALWHPIALCAVGSLPAAARIWTSKTAGTTHGDSFKTKANANKRMSKRMCTSQASALLALLALLAVLALLALLALLWPTCAIPQRCIHLL